jgi:hypothetical protein
MFTRANVRSAVGLPRSPYRGLARRARKKQKPRHRTAFTCVYVIVGARLWKTSIRVERTFRYATLRASFAMLRWILRLQTTLL